MKLTEKLCAIMGELKPIVKKHHSTGVTYAFRSIDEVVNAINPLLVKHGVFVTCEILAQSFESFTTTKYTKDGNPYEQRGFYAHVTARYWLHSGDEKMFTDMQAGSMDYSDKAETQAMSMALKYAYIQCFNITTADLKDPDGVSHEVVIPQKPAETPKKEFKPAPPIEIDDNKFSWEFLKKGEWDGTFTDGNIITITGQKTGKKLRIRLSDFQKDGAEEYLKSLN